MLQYIFRHLNIKLAKQAETARYTDARFDIYAYWFGLLKLKCFKRFENRWEVFETICLIHLGFLENNILKH